MAISAKELAQKLNVSTATISMVLNHKSGISTATREKILAGAKEYGFDLSKYYAHAEEPRNICFINYKKSGKVVTDTPFFSELTEGISSACKANNINLSISYIYGTEPVKPQLKAITDKEYSGVLLLATEMEEADFTPFLSLPYPLVALDCYYDTLQLDTVLINNIQGAYLATSHLAAQGFRRIGYLKSSLRIANFEERADGYYKALRHHQLEKNSAYVIELTPSMEGAYLDMKSQLANGPALAEAYFADNDLIASGAMRAFQEAGLCIPEDISIIGFDDMPICSFLSPALSTMRVQKHDLGVLAIEQLLNKLNNPTRPPVKLELASSLVSRASVGSC